MKKKPDMSFWGLFNLSFGFFGVQIAYALQSANISRIFATLGADPHQLSFFWILPPLMGMIVQPIIGMLSDKTWCRWAFSTSADKDIKIHNLGRRIPYLFVGAVIAVAVMALLPNAGSLGLTTQLVMWGLSGTMLFGLFSLMFLDTSINIAMQPFKMMVGDMVNEEQKGLGYSIQSFLCNAGSLVGYLFPYIFTAIGVQNIAPEGVVPDSVIYSFYIGAAILILCVIYTTCVVKEWDPETYAKYNGITESRNDGDAESRNDGMTESRNSGDSEIRNSVTPDIHDSAAPSVKRAFLSIGLVQFFCWAAFMYMWTYTNGAIADNCWGTTDVKSAGYQEAGNWVGVVFAVQAVGSVLWAMVIPRFKTNYKLAYIVSLILGGIGFASVNYITDQYVLFLSFLLIGCAWAAMLALPFTLFTNAIQGTPKMGTYLGLFNCTICLPQIIAAICGGSILALVGTQSMMFVVAGILLFLGAAAVMTIKE